MQSTIIQFKNQINRTKKVAANYIIFDSNGNALYSGESSNVFHRLAQHRTNLRKLNRFNNIKCDVNYSDDFSAFILLEEDRTERMKTEKVLHERLPNLLSSAGYGYEVAARKAAKTASIQFPNGDKHTITNIGKFCRDHNLDMCHMSKVLNGIRKHHLGYKGSYIL